MGVTRDDIDWIAGLARLELEPGEAEALTEDLNGILRHVDELREARAEPGERAAPTVEAHREGGAPLRDGRSDRPDRLERPPSEVAPEWKDGFFVVPKLPAVDVEDPFGEAGADEAGIPDEGAAGRGASADGAGDGARP